MKYTFISNVNHFDLQRIEDLLNEHRIKFFIKSTLESSVNAGWMNPGSSFNEKMLFVDQSKVDETQELLKKYMEDYCD